MDGAYSIMAAGFDGLFPGVAYLPSSMQISGSLIQAPWHPGHLPGLCSVSLWKTNPHLRHVAGVMIAW
jgi:hypothetical protein